MKLKTQGFHARYSLKSYFFWVHIYRYRHILYTHICIHDIVTCVCAEKLPHLYVKYNISVLQAIVSAYFQHIFLLGLPVESLGEAQLAGNRMEFKWNLRCRLVAGRMFASVNDGTGMMIEWYQGIGQSTNGIRIEGFEHRNDGVGWRILGDLEFPWTLAPCRCHVVLIEHRHAHLQ